MSVKQKFLVVSVTAGLLTAGAWYLQPHTTAEVDHHRIEQQVENGSDAQEKAHEDLERQGVEDGEANRRDDLVPVEGRPAHVEPRLRWRW